MKKVLFNGMSATLLFACKDAGKQPGQSATTDTTIKTAGDSNRVARIVLEIPLFSFIFNFQFSIFN